MDDVGLTADRCASRSKVAAVAAVAAVASPNRAAAPPRCRRFAQQGGGASRSALVSRFAQAPPVAVLN